MQAENVKQHKITMFLGRSMNALGTVKFTGLHLTGISAMFCPRAARYDGNIISRYFSQYAMHITIFRFGKREKKPYNIYKNKLT